jgi:choline monooxygenase
MKRSLDVEIGPDSSWYLAEEQLKREGERLFLKQWHFICAASALASQGATVVDTLLGRSIFVRRSKDGAMRGFHNVCRHRGGPLVRSDQAKCKALRCLYHGWEYDDSGSLIRTPQFNYTRKAGFDYSEYSLYPLQLSEWRGLIFVNFDINAPAIDLSLGDLPSLLGEFEASSFQGAAHIKFVFSCNWKLYVENWLESYHLPWVHAGLSKDVNVSEYSVIIHDRVVEHVTGRRRNDSIYGGFWAWLAPNLSWNFYDGGFSLERMLPIGPDKTEVQYTFLFRNDVSEEARRAAMQMTERVTREDGEMCEAVYRSMQSGIFRRGPISPRHEAAISYFHAYLAQSAGTAG